MASELASKTCVPCRGGVPSLKGAELKKLHAQVNDAWKVVLEHHLIRIFPFPDFQTALDFVNQAGAIAEEQGHHPDILLTWGKAEVKIWSFFGTTSGLSLLRAYRLPEAQEIYEQLEWGDVAVTALRSVVVVPRVLWRCSRMHKRWPWSGFDSYLHTPLIQIRREYGIQLLLR